MHARWLTQGLRQIAALTRRPAPPVDEALIAATRSSPLPVYAAFGHWAPATAEVEPRLELLVAQLSAELSGCLWCIHQGRHHWRKAYFATDALSALLDYPSNPLYSDRDRAALALAAAVVRYSSQDPAAADSALADARLFFTETEIARITRIAAQEHFFNPATGAIGLDTVDSPASSSGVGASSDQTVPAGRS